MTNDLDYVRHGTYFRSFVHTPKLPTQEEVAPYAEALQESVPAKLKELCVRIHELDKIHADKKEKINRLVMRKKLDSFMEYFWTYFAACEHGEVEYAQRWLRYWLRILEMATGVKNVQLAEFAGRGVTQEQIQRAKEVPIEQLYTGELKTLGNRATGRCPFHEERTPSFTIFLDNNTYFCFGCQAWGDAVDFYSKTHDVGMVDAVRDLCQMI